MQNSITLDGMDVHGENIVLTSDGSSSKSLKSPRARKWEGYRPIACTAWRGHHHRHDDHHRSHRP